MPRPTFTTDVEADGGYVFRLKCKVYTGHVRSSMYVGKKGSNFALTGVLSLRHKEFEAFCNLLGVDADYEWETDIRKENLPENEQPV